MRKFACLILVSLIVISAYGFQKRWKGKTFEEQGVLIVENEGPGLWEGASNKKIDFIDDLSIGEETGKDYLMFRDKLDVAVDSEGNIYILDIGNQRILKFDKKGEFIWEAGRRGQGPGEFQSQPSHYTYSIKLTPSEDIAVRDDRNIHFFSKSGDYKKTLKIDARVWDFDFFPDERLLVSLSLVRKVGNSAAFYSSDGEFKSVFSDEYILDTIKVNFGVNCGARYIVKSDKVYVSLPGPYEIREYDFKGKLLRKIRRDLKLESPFVKVMDGGGVHDSNCSGPCYPLKNGMIVNLVTLVNVEGEKKQKFGEREITIPILDIRKFIDFFNDKGQFLGTYELNDRELRFIDDEDFFYFSVTDPYPYLVRAKLK